MLLLCSLLLASCASGGTSTTSPPPTPSTGPTPVSFAGHWTLGPVDDIAVSPEAAFVLYSPAGSNGDQAHGLARVDRKSGTVLTAGPFPYAMNVAVSQGVVWIGNTNPDPGAPAAGSSTVVAADAGNLAVRQQLTLPAEGHSARIAHVTANGDSLWVGYGTNIFRLAVRDGRTLGSAAVGGVATSISIDPAGRRLYVGINGVAGTSASIIEMDAATLKPLATSTTGGADLGGPQLSAGAQDVWVAFATGMLGQVEHHQAADLASVPVVYVPHSNGVRIFVIAGMVWVTDLGAGGLECLDQQTGAIRAFWSSPRAGVIAGDGSELYYGDLNGAGSLEIDSRCQ